MNIQDIAARIKLVTFTRGFWRPVKLNRAESKVENDRHNTGDRVKVHVRICDHPALTTLGKLHAESYQEHIRLTLPSCLDGLRVVPVGRELEHAKAMTAFANRHDVLRDEFLKDYDAERLAAPVVLNGLFDAKQWPDVERVKTRFCFRTEYLPCPTDGQWADWLNESAQLGQAEFAERLVSAARHLASVCNGDGKLYESVINNLADLCALTGDMNLMDDPIVSRLASQMSAITDTVCAKSLRESDSLRKSTASKAADILKGLGL